MLCDQFAEVIQDQTCINFLTDQILFPAVEVYQTDRILQFAET